MSKNTAVIGARPRKASKFKKGDTVVVITGKDKGKKGNVLRIIREEDRAIVEGVNMCTKHVKARGKAQAGRVQTENPVHLSNLKVLCPETKKSTRIGFETGKDGKKYRIAKASGVNVEKPFVKS